MNRPISLPMLALAFAWAAGPAVAQDARACADELGRLGAAFGIDEDRGEATAAIGQQPGARRGAKLTVEQRRQIADRMDQARQAGERGDGQVCLQGLEQARASLRQAGLGGGQPGTAVAPGAATSGGAAGSAGTPTTLPSAAGSAGSVPGSTAVAPGGAAGAGGAAGGAGGGSSGGSGGGN